MKIVGLVAILAAALMSACFAQSEDNIPPEKAAILALDRAYEAAFAKGDAKQLASFFAADAEHTTEEGTILRGREEIEKAIREGLKANNRLAIAMESVRLLTPEVIVERGTSTVTDKDGEESSSLYTAIYVKKAGEWKISQLVETSLPPATAHDRLQELAWLIGDWEDADKSNDLNVRSQFLWARGGNFLTRNVTVKRAGETNLEGWQIIGWDPIDQQIRSWTFDSAGGFAEGHWTREGDRWLLREIGVTPDGTRTTADNTFTKLTADRFTWESNNRTLDGAPQPNIPRLEVIRVKGN